MPLADVSHMLQSRSRLYCNVLGLDHDRGVMTMIKLLLHGVIRYLKLRHTADGCERAHANWYTISLCYSRCITSILQQGHLEKFSLLLSGCWILLCTSESKLECTAVHLRVDKLPPHS